jgi:hypothetical protein
LDTAIIVGVIIGCVVAMVLVFGKTVLGVAWTGNNTKGFIAVQGGSKNKIVQQHSQDKNDASINNASSKLNNGDGNRNSSHVEQ